MMEKQFFETEYLNMRFPDRWTLGFVTQPGVEVLGRKLEETEDPRPQSPYS